MSTKILRTILLAALALVPLNAFAEGTFAFTYGGRLTTSAGKPVKGPVSLKVTFFHEFSAQTPILTVSQGLESIGL